jgi:hypothetical protein
MDGAAGITPFSGFSLKPRLRSRLSIGNCVEASDPEAAASNKAINGAHS